MAAVISGHSHIANCETRAGVLYFNPGSAGPRRWGKAVSLGRLTIEDGKVTGEILTLRVDPTRR
ncbi:MAG TPA: metallophosphoesterase family protein, partial [Polyangia bacterium]